MQKKYLIALGMVLFSTSVYAITQPTSSSKPLPSLQQTQNIDTVLSEKVQSVIEKNPVLKSQSVTAASHDGIIMLQGSVETKAQEKAAIANAKSVKGVKGVESQLTVKLIGEHITGKHNE